MRVCHASLKPNALLVFKENVTNPQTGNYDFIWDREDSSICRSHQHYLYLFNQVSDLFQLVHQREQRWKSLLPVNMYALKKI